MMALVRSALSDELRKPEYRGDHPSRGHCYVASEALYHLMGGRLRVGLKPMFIKHEGEPHWFLMLDEMIIDPTVDQFEIPPDYDKAVGKGFLTRQPSKRAQTVLDRIRCCANL